MSMLPGWTSSAYAGAAVVDEGKVDWKGESAETAASSNSATNIFNVTRYKHLMLGFICKEIVCGQLTSVSDCDALTICK